MFFLCVDDTGEDTGSDIEQVGCSSEPACGEGCVYDECNDKCVCATVIPPDPKVDISTGSTTDCSGDILDRFTSTCTCECGTATRTTIPSCALPNDFTCVDGCVADVERRLDKCYRVCRCSNGDIQCGDYFVDSTDTPCNIP